MVVLPGGSQSVRRTSRVTFMCPAEDARWYESSNGRLVLMTSTAALSLLVLVLSMTAFLCQRARRAKACKGPM